jgi:hypothetical protein
VGYVPFLELGLEPYSADVYASENFALNPLSQYHLQKEFGEFSSTMRNVISHLATCLNVTTLMALRYFKENNGSE